MLATWTVTSALERDGSSKSRHVEEVVGAQVLVALRLAGATHPEITFRSTKVEKTGGDDFAMTGDLTIKGVTKPVTGEFEHTGVARDPYGNLRAGFDGKAVITRGDWGINFNAALETGGVLVSDKITLEFDVSAIKNATS